MPVNKTNQRREIKNTAYRTVVDLVDVPEGLENEEGAVIIKEGKVNYNDSNTFVPLTIEIDPNQTRILLRKSLDAATNVEQEPVGLDQFIDIDFGGAQNTPQDDVNIDTDGVVYFNSEGKYYVYVDLSVGRDANNGVAHVFARLIKDLGGGNYNVFTSPKYVRLNNSRFIFPIIIEDVDDYTQNNRLKVQLGRDSVGGQGVNDGGLKKQDATGLGWGENHTARIRVYKVE